MPKAKSKNSVGLGNSLMNDRFGKGSGSGKHHKGSAVTRINHATGEEYITNEKKEASWVKMRSVTQQSAMDEFLATAQLAGTDFTAEKTNNVKIIHTDQRNPYLLSAAEEHQIRGKHDTHKGRLTVPRRPKWNERTTPQELDQLERESFLNWRRGLAELQENNDLLMTPFERNLEVWRQLWRVIERSHVVVQIVDARNPLMFRSDDLEAYVKDVDSKKENLLLVNKADMMTEKQRKAWAKYFKEKKIAYRFFSAHLAKESIDARELEEAGGLPQIGEGSGANQNRKLDSKQAPEDSEDESDGSDENDEETGQDSEDESEEEEAGPSGASLDQEDDDDTRIMTVEELDEMFLQHAPAPDPERPNQKLTIGLVGYPNVGKSSTINALIGAKKVSVSATPGKTKHFQTIHLSDNVILCDCPGLVFPNFATTKADLVCNGVLPIDQLREYSAPATLVTQRIPQPFLEAVYGMKINTRPVEEGGTGTPTSSELLRAYARARGYQTQGFGAPDESRAARTILKDYVAGKLLYVEPPPGYQGDASEFNRELYVADHLPEKRRAALETAMQNLELPDDATEDTEIQAMPGGAKSKKLDKAFFASGNGNAGHMAMPFHTKYTEQGQTNSATDKKLSRRKARDLIAAEQGIDPKDVQLGNSKKHFKGGAKAKGKKKADPTLDDEMGY